ncbi:MAG: SDR family oxidoreductase [Clostridia bacterium]|nr:SDR family oxidoreductase [Clostridia bacterium]
MFKGKTVIVTGGANGIGKCIANRFKEEGAFVEIIDIAQGDHFVGDIGKKEDIDRFVQDVLSRHEKVDILINNAKPIMKGLDNCSYEEFQYALSVGVTAPFYITKLLKDSFSKNASIVNISSSRDRMSQSETESYTAAKGGIASLTHALMMSLAGKVRVNSVSPGWIETGKETWDGPDAYQQPSGRVGNTNDIADVVLFLCSDSAGFINGENICVDGGMTKQMIYHNDAGWTLK